MNDFKATFHKGGYCNFDSESEDCSAIIKSSEAMGQYIEEIIFKQKNEMMLPDGFWKEQENNIREFYSQYNDAFFENNILVIALVDRGSGSYKHELTNLSVNNNDLLINIKRKTGMIMTMDYVPWTLTLELDNRVYSFNSISIVLEK